MGIYDVEDYLSRARAFIAAGDENSLRHACLELRLSLERIIYTKLGQIGEKLPPEVYRKWQPPKALKLLLSFEPKADQDMSLTLTSQAGVPFHIGEYKMFTSHWLNKHYQKLGNFLHAPALADSLKPSSLSSEAVQAIFDEIERVATSSMLMSINAINVFDCEVCEGDMYASQAQIDAHATVECPKCGNKHLVRPIEEGSYEIELSNMDIVTCMKCKSPMALNHLEQNDKKACWNCGQLHHFDWCYGMVEQEA
ncbi:hypothetical protein [Pseudomonas atacamensis]|uniref:hypothetical protein n=1 Tax=Pseudomonas atacamensis TaxID=2565368 RepID=UPI0024816A88|nr:hypothetical protein [Pseudomonas atacamensis]WGT32978.1 hypothetical protein QG303_21810 [Pseudomonas atacamensis]